MSLFARYAEHLAYKYEKYFHTGRDDPALQPIS
jgi:hypothetical protein